jgi:hypothetical protein
MLDLATGQGVIVLKEDHIPYEPVLIALVALAINLLFTTWVIVKVCCLSPRRRRGMDGNDTQAAASSAALLADIEGHPDPKVVMSWHNVSCAYTTSPNRQTGGKPKVTMALQQASGELHSGQITAIMGARYVIQTNRKTLYETTGHTNTSFDCLCFFANVLKQLPCTQLQWQRQDDLDEYLGRSQKDGHTQWYHVDFW